MLSFATFVASREKWVAGGAGAVFSASQ
jgi:hypothetical protein